MKSWGMLAIVCLAGAIVGVINALLTDNGLVKPDKERVGGIKVYRPGFLGNVFTGAIASGVSWGLYGPLASF